MQTYQIFEGDVGYNIPFLLTNYDGSQKDITNLVPKVKVWYQGNPATLLFGGSTSIDSATTGSCHYTITSSTPKVTGTFLAEVELWNTTSGFLQTWGQFQLVMKESPG